MRSHLARDLKRPEGEPWRMHPHCAAIRRGPYITRVSRWTAQPAYSVHVIHVPSGKAWGRRDTSVVAALSAILGRYVALRDAVLLDDLVLLAVSAEALPQCQRPGEPVSFPIPLPVASKQTRRDMVGMHREPRRGSARIIPFNRGPFRR